MGRVVTSISIDEEKRDLAKKKGIVLKDLLDNALDIALGIELKESTQLMNEKEKTFFCWHMSACNVCFLDCSDLLC